jgi:hypothetical protein
MADPAVDNPTLGSGGSAKANHRQKYNAKIEPRVALTCRGFFLRRAGTEARCRELARSL